MPLRTGYLLDDQAPKQDVWNAHMRWVSYDLLNLFLRLFHGDTNPAAGGTVVGGLVCSSGVGLASDVTEGLALYYDPAIYTATVDGDETVAPLGVAYLEADDTVGHSAGDGANPRYDIITIKSVIGTDRQKAVQQKGGGTSNQDTRWGQETTIQITEGTPAGAPVVPTTPAGETLLAVVLVPMGAAASAAFTYTDGRTVCHRKASVREWWRTVSISKGAGAYQTAGVGVEGVDWAQSADGLMTLAHTSNVAALIVSSEPIPLDDAVGQKIVGCVVDHTVGAVHGGAGSSYCQLQFWDASAASWTDLVGATVLSNTVARHEDVLTVSPTPLVEEGDALRVELWTNFVVAGGPDGATISYHAVRIQLQDGRTS
ncbi:MAG: hypothetical protein ABIL09_11140 [Gemmatimonadota bacterium]